MYFIIKAFDGNKVPFTAIILCTDKDINEMKTEKNIDLYKYNIIYKIIGHDNYDTIITKVNDYIKEYIFYKNNTS